MFEQYMEQMKTEAEEMYPQEAVWLITRKGCRLVDNLAENTEESFRVSEQDTFLAYKEGLLAVVHSHCDEPVAPSKLDMEGQELSGVTWGIIQVVEGNYRRHIWWGDDVPRQPLLGRIFIHGVSDCWNLVRDFYAEHGVKLGIVPRVWQAWIDRSPFEDLWEEFGFVEVPRSQAQYGDMIYIKVRGDHTHHCGVMVGDEEFLHHPGSDEPYNESRLSIKENVHRYMPYITRVLRHPDMKDKQRIEI